jgi:hypothetical protein
VGFVVINLKDKGKVIFSWKREQRDLRDGRDKRDLSDGRA